ncbi:MAG: efflux RND transporter periplasmic adaptor subunit [Azoarcus sp.]|jgi:HlyD family secretion protein|nr:efflux RND transporter periplasmic adaptor subunit [Azoarcus sp.]
MLRPFLKIPLSLPLRLRGTHVLAIAATVLGCGLVILSFARSKPVDVTVQVAKLGKIEATVINTRAGTVEACQRTRLSTITGGRIDYLGVAEGDRVKAGQVLMRLWQGDLLASQAVARARQIAASQRQREACAIAAQAGKEAKRQEELVRNNFVSSNAGEKTRAEADARHAACASAEAETETSARQLESISADLDRTVIIAPFDGTIAKINGELGEISTPSPTGIAMPPAIDLIDDSCLYVKVPMDEADAPKIQFGQLGRISVEAIKGKHFTGTVRRVAPYITALEKQARTVDVDIDFANPEEARGLLVGYSADVEIVLASNPKALLIPVTALRKDGKVFVLGGNGIIAERAVTAGIANWEQVEITSGLKPGERVIVSSNHAELVPGARARLKTNTR